MKSRVLLAAASAFLVTSGAALAAEVTHEEALRIVSQVSVCGAPQVVAVIEGLGLPTPLLADPATFNTAALLASPNLATIFALCDNDPRVFFVMYDDEIGWFAPIVDTDRYQILTNTGTNIYGS